VYRAGPDVTSTQLAGWLELSRDSVHQLLLPLVRSGLVAAGRGRNGGYRPTPLAAPATVLSVVSFYSREGRDPSPEPSSTPAAILRLDRELFETHRRFLSGMTNAQIVAEVKAEREEISYSI
jgi:DNA-binding IscR family transcriptional regulator